MPKITIDIEEDDLDQLKDLCHEVATQDAFGTAHPVYLLQDKRMYSAEDGHQDGTEWLDDEGGHYTEEDMRKEIVEREIATEETAKEMQDWEMADQLNLSSFNFQEIDETQDFFLTRKAAEQTMEARVHHYKKPFIYVGSAHVNDEIQFVRKLLTILGNQLK